jgi:pimeloyl-ACP methyl ester carboxylesterase
MRGPQSAAGLLLYFHGNAGREDATKDPLPLIFTEMAKAATWDVVKINRRPPVDVESEDDHVLQVVAERIALARQDGYKRIIVGGASRGGWLALLAATLPGVDVAVGLAPGTTSYEPEVIRRTLGVLAQKLAAARAKRIAAFFFEGDPLEDLDERRAAVLRQALQGKGPAFMLVDRPADLAGHAGGATGRFVRRYRDCLLRFIQNDGEPPGEVQCSTSSGYAIGSEIRFPASDSSFRTMPADGDPAFAPFWGRWEGDDEHGDYLIMEAGAASPKRIDFEMGFSDGPEKPIRRRGTADVPFEYDRACKCLYYELPARDGLIVIRVRSATELEYEYQSGELKQPAASISHIVLHKRSREGGDNP